LKAKKLLEKRNGTPLGCRKVFMERKKKNALLAGLTHGMAIAVLSKLCDDKNLEEIVLKAVDEELRRVDADEVAKKVFYGLNALDVDELYEHSGKTHYGYEEPSDVAYEMAEGAIAPFVRDIEKYRKLGMKAAEKETCRGVVRGLLLYDEKGDSEFKDWIPDAAVEFADDIVQTYGEYNTAADLADIQSECGEE
jgi:hypothetical protein